MSLFRLIIWTGLIGGWAAFFGWLFAELILHSWINTYQLVGILMATLVAIPIGGGICFASGLTNPKIDIMAKRLGLGFAGGLAGGLIGAVLGSCVFGGLNQISVNDFVLFVSRVVGF